VLCKRGEREFRGYPFTELELGFHRDMFNALSVTPLRLVFRFCQIPNRLEAPPPKLFKETSHWQVAREASARPDVAILFLPVNKGMYRCNIKERLPAPR